jgi:hypothetical protein
VSTDDKLLLDDVDIFFLNQASVLRGHLTEAPPHITFYVLSVSDFSGTLMHPCSSRKPGVGGLKGTSSGCSDGGDTQGNEKNEAATGAGGAGGGVTNGGISALPTVAPLWRCPPLEWAEDYF